MHGSGLGHLEVNHIRGVLECRHCLLMTHILKHDVVHLNAAIVEERGGKFIVSTLEHLVSYCDNITHRTSQHNNES